MIDSIANLGEFPETPKAVGASGGCGSCGTREGGERCGNGLEKIYPTTAVRFGFMRMIGEFTHAPELKFTCGAKVVIQTRRGIEIGEQVSLTCHGCDKSVTRDEMRAWVEANDDNAFIFDAGRILREATAADLAEYHHIQEGARERQVFAQGVSRRLGLPMKVVECECPFGGERIIFYFRSDERVDFREMVKELAREFRTRIEMRQVGARDEARLLADYETCGREVCCKVFLKTLKPISMKMAKLQKATLDPSKVSGRCGRLKCCLRYEHESYEELEARLPKMGMRIGTRHGNGVVINRQTLTQLVQIRLDDDTVRTVVMEDVLPPGEELPEPPKPPRRSREDRPRQRDNRRGRSRDSAETSTESPKEGTQQESESAGSGEGQQPSESGGGRGRGRRPRRRSGRRRSSGPGKTPGGQEAEGGGSSGSTPRTDEQGGDSESRRKRGRRPRRKPRRRRGDSGEQSGSGGPSGA